MKAARLFCLYLISIAVLTACGFNSSIIKGSNQSEKVYTLDLNIPYPDSSDISKAHYYAYKWLPKVLEERSGGRLKVNVYLDGQLAELSEMLDAMQNGAIDMGYANMAFYADQIPEAFVTSFPFIANSIGDDAEKAHEFLCSTEIAEVLNQALKERGLTPLMHTYFSPVGWLSNKRIQSVEDMDGLVIASYGGLVNRWYEELGVIGVDVPPTEWYNVLARGVAEGIPAAFITLDNLNLKDVIDYVIFPAYDPAISTLLINSNTLEKLPEDLQKLIEEVSKEAELLAVKGSKEDMKQMMKKLHEFEEAGDIEILQLSDHEADRFYEKVQPMFDRFASMSEGSAKIVEIIREYNSR